MKETAVVHRKVALLGTSSVGKSSLANAFVTGGFMESYDPTIESTYHKVVRFRKVHFATDIVDTAGMDEYSQLTRNASLGVHGYAMVFSIANRWSFEKIKLLNEILLTALGIPSERVARVLVGTMKDLASQRQVSQQDAQTLANSWGVPYVECSSKTAENVAEVFHTLLKEVEKDDGLLAETGDGGCFIL